MILEVKAKACSKRTPKFNYFRRSIFIRIIYSSIEKELLRNGIISKTSTSHSRHITFFVFGNCDLFIESHKTIAIDHYRKMDVPATHYHYCYEMQQINHLVGD